MSGTSLCCNPMIVDDEDVWQIIRSKRENERLAKEAQLAKENEELASKKGGGIRRKSKKRDKSGHSVRTLEERLSTPLNPTLHRLRRSQSAGRLKSRSGWGLLKNIVRNSPEKGNEERGRQVMAQTERGRSKSRKKDRDQRTENADSFSDYSSSSRSSDDSSNYSEQERMNKDQGRPPNGRPLRRMGSKLFGGSHRNTHGNGKKTRRFSWGKKSRDKRRNG